MKFDDFAQLVRTRRSQLIVDQERDVEIDLINQLCSVATWAPNHQQTWPWVFGVFTGESRRGLSNATADAMQRNGDSEMKVTKTRTKYLRAPVVVIVGSAPGESALQNEENRDAVAAGIPVITMNSGLESSKEVGALMHVGQPEFLAGQSAGARAKAEGATKGLCFIQEAYNTALNDRCNGYGEAVPIKLVDSSNDPATIPTRAAAGLQANPDVDAVLSVGPHVCVGVQQAIDELGMSVHHSCFDLSPPVMDMINDALNGTLSRTFNTSFTTVFVLLVIFIFGGEVIRGFMFALVLGIVVGTYSSIFIASPISYDSRNDKHDDE